MLRVLRPSALEPAGDSSEHAGVPPAWAEERSDPLRALVAEARSGDLRAARTLMVALGPTLLRVVRGVLGAQDPDVEDALQEVMASVFSALPGFRGECKTKHFASRIALQVALNARRRSSYRKHYTPSVPPEEIELFAGDERSPADSTVAARRREALRGLLLELAPAQSEVLVLHVVLGYSVEETADATGAPVNTVRSRLRTGLARLRERVREDQALVEIVKGGT